MKKLLNVLYVTTPNSYLSLEGETVVIRREEEEVFRIPLLNLEGIVTFGYTGASPALMGQCAKRNISLCFMKKNGRFLARVVGGVSGNVLLRKRQYELSNNENESLHMAIPMIQGKIFNSRWIVERMTRDHAMRVDMESLKQTSNVLRDFL